MVNSLYRTDTTSPQHRVRFLLPLWPSIAPKRKKRKTHFDTKHTVHIVVTCLKRHKERKRGLFFTHRQKQQVFDEDNKCNSQKHFCSTPHHLLSSLSATTLTSQPLRCLYIAMTSFSEHYIHIIDDYRLS